MSARGVLAHCALALIAFGACAMTLQRVLGRPAEDLSIKLELFEEIKDEVDLVFVGSSHVIRHIDPTVFDATLRERGVDLTSFNLGVWGSDLLPSSYVLRELARMKPARLRYVVVDPDLLRLELGEGTRNTRRARQWHDLPTTFLALKCILDQDRGIRDSLSLARDHLVPFAYHALNLGVLREWLRSVLEPDLRIATDLRSAELAGANRDGFLSLDRLRLGLSGPRRQALDQRWRQLHGDQTLIKVYQRALERLRAWQPKVPEADPAVDRVLAEMMNTIENLGAQAAFVLGPSVAARPAVHAARENGTILELLDYNRPDEYPELFALEYRFDVGHLSESGAHWFSRRLAEDLAESLLSR